MKLGERVMALPTREPTKRVRPVTNPTSRLVLLPAVATAISTELSLHRKAFWRGSPYDGIEVEFDGGGQLYVGADEVRPLSVVERIAGLA